jgi:hypothetical protein
MQKKQAIQIIVAILTMILLAGLITGVILLAVKKPCSKSLCLSKFPLTSKDCQAKFPITSQDCATNFPITQLDCATNFPITQQDCVTNFPITRQDCTTNFPITQQDCSSNFPITSQDCELNFPCPPPREPPRLPSNLPFCVGKDKNQYFLKGDTLRPNQSLFTCEGLINLAGNRMLVNQSDGQIALYDLQNNTRIFGNRLNPFGQSFFDARGSTPVTLQFSESGLYSIVDSTGNELFRSTNPAVGGTFVNQDDGNIMTFNSSNQAVHDFGTDFSRITNLLTQPAQ